MKRNRQNIKWSEIYKTTTLTVWLAASGYLMFKIYLNPILLSQTDNNWSNLIAIIGIIIATLIGWQIYSAMDWNSKAERLSKIEETGSSLVKEIKDVRSYAEASTLFIEALNIMAELGEEPNKKDGYEDNLTEIYTLLLQALCLFAGPTLEETIERCISKLQYTIGTMSMYGIKPSTSFHEKCEELFENIKSNKQNLTNAQWNKLKAIHKSRTEL